MAGRNFIKLRGDAELEIRKLQMLPCGVMLFRVEPFYERAAYLHILSLGFQIVFGLKFQRPDFAPSYYI